jgi:hypothetical protein
MVARVRAETFTRSADRRLNALLVAAPRIESWTRRADRRLNRLLVRAWPRLARAGRRVRAALAPWGRWVSRRLRPVAILLLRAFSLAERRLRQLATATTRGATRVSAAITPERAICGVLVASAACLVASQFVPYRAVELGQPGYAGLPGVAEPPTRGVENAGDAHAYLLIPVALLAAGLSIFAALAPRRRKLGRTIALLGLLSLAVVLLVDRPAGLDEGVEASRFSGATAVLESGFYAELAAAGGLVLGGVLLSGGLRPQAVRHRYRPRKRSMARTQGGSTKRAHLFGA